MGVSCVAVPRGAEMTNRENRLKSGRRNRHPQGSAGDTFSTMYKWLLPLVGTGRAPRMSIRTYIGSVARRAERMQSCTFSMTQYETTLSNILIGVLWSIIGFFLRRLERHVRNTPG